MPTNIYSTMTTIAATIVSQLDSALTDSTNFAGKTLAEVSLVLMLITLLTNVAAGALVRRASGTALPIGRGV
jgi:phosphate transport system permease protein